MVANFFCFDIIAFKIRVGIKEVNVAEERIGIGIATFLLLHLPTAVVHRFFSTPSPVNTFGLTDIERVRYGLSASLRVSSNNFLSCSSKLACKENEQKSVIRLDKGRNRLINVM
ncbi:hypothetical protein ACVXG7_28855 [Enterobacter hormaechei]